MSLRNILGKSHLLQKAERRIVSLGVLNGQIFAFVLFRRFANHDSLKDFNGVLVNTWMSGHDLTLEPTTKWVSLGNSHEGILRLAPGGLRCDTY